MKKTKLQPLVLPCIGLFVTCLFGSGCSTALNGTARPIYPVSNIVGSRFLCNSNAPSYEANGAIPVFKLRSYNKGPFDIEAITPGGQVQHKTVVWVDKTGKYFVVGGAVGWGVVGGVAGLVSLGVDLGTRSYREFDNNTIAFTFDRSLENSVPTSVSAPAATPAPPPSRAADDRLAEQLTQFPPATSPPAGNCQPAASPVGSEY